MLSISHRLVLACGLLVGVAWLAASVGVQPSHQATAAAVQAIPQFTVAASEPAPKLTAASYLVFDVESGEPLIAHDADAVRPIASITKLVTAAVAAEIFTGEEPIRVTERDVATFGRAGSLQAGQSYALRELQVPLLLESSNDAAAAIARAGGSDFIDRMEHWAAAAGARDVTFADSSGLSAENRASARDIAAVLRTLQTERPAVLDITRLSRYLGPYTGWSNNNPVSPNADYRGGKHGYTNASKLTIAALFAESLAAGERTLGYVVLGSEDLAADVASLRGFVARSVHFE